MALHILHLTDLHLHARPDYIHMGVNPRDSLKAVLKHALDHQSRIDLILITGDLTHDESASAYDYLQTLLSDINIPVHILPGNHDVASLIKSHLLNEQIHANDQILFPEWQIIMLDSTITGQEGGYLGPQQMQRLQQCLQQQAQKYSLICLHHQPLQVGSRWLDTMLLQDAATFVQMIVKHPMTRAVLWGHVHQEFYQYKHLRHWMATPASCRQFLPGSDTFAIDPEKGAGYRSLTLNDDGSIDTQVIWV